MFLIYIQQRKIKFCIILKNIFFLLFSDYLDELGFHFVRQCIEVIESRGLDDEGLYRLVGVSSKVNKLTQMALGMKHSFIVCIFLLLYLLIFKIA